MKKAYILMMAIFLFTLNICNVSAATINEQTPDNVVNEIEASSSESEAELDSENTEIEEPDLYLDEQTTSQEKNLIKDGAVLAADNSGPSVQKEDSIETYSQISRIQIKLATGEYLGDVPHKLNFGNSESFAVDVFVDGSEEPLDKTDERAQVEWSLSYADGSECQDADVSTMGDNRTASVSIPFTETKTDYILKAQSASDENMSAQIAINAYVYNGRTKFFKFSAGDTGQENVHAGGDNPIVTEEYDKETHTYSIVLPENPYKIVVPTQASTEHIYNSKFLGWLYDGKLYQPGDVITQSAMVLLEPAIDASWGEMDYIVSKGIAYVYRDDYFDVGVDYVTNRQENAEYRFLYYDIEKDVWGLICDWSKYSWTHWKTNKGAYWLRAELRIKDSNGEITDTADTTVGFQYVAGNTQIEGIYAGPAQNGKGILLGCTSTSKDPGVTYSFKIYDCEKGIWTYLSDKNKAQWITWKAKKGVYWIHYEVYTKDGRLADTRTYTSIIWKDTV